jgi:hypothetical protein
MKQNSTQAGQNYFIFHDSIFIKHHTTDEIHLETKCHATFWYTKNDSHELMHCKFAVQKWSIV